MEMVSVSKMRRVSARVGLSRDYARLALELVVNLYKDRKLSHALLAEREEGKTLAVLITSNKGLCGSYNTRIAKLFSEFLKENDGVECMPVGKTAIAIARARGVENVIFPFHFSETMTPDDARRLSDELVRLYKTGAYKKVVIFYTQFVRQLEYHPRVRTMLPLSPKTMRSIIEETAFGSSEDRFSRSSMKDYEFEPNPSDVLDRVLPMLLGAITFQICLESLAAEHSSRMVAMKNATDNAGELLDELTLSFNRARQSAITQEVSEIIGGANALAI